MYFSYPPCFPTKDVYRDWMRLARIAKEVACVCDDCSSEYERQMKSTDRCQKEWVILNLTLNYRGNTRNETTNPSQRTFEEIVPFPK